MYSYYVVYMVSTSTVLYKAHCRKPGNVNRINTKYLKGKYNRKSVVKHVQGRGGGCHRLRAGGVPLSAYNMRVGSIDKSHTDRKRGVAGASSLRFEPTV